MGRVIRLAMCWLVLASFGVAYGQAALKAGVELEGFTPARTRTVSTLSDLQAALADARPSDLIEVTAGEYVTEEPIIVRGLTGLPDAPIVIRAAQRGKARIVGEAGFHVVDSSYVVLEGFDMAHRTGHAFMIDGCHHVRVTRNHISLIETDENFESRAVFDWVEIGGAHSYLNRVDHNLMEGKRTRGVMMQVGGAGKEFYNESTRYDRVDHNYFRNFAKGQGNGYETVRLGKGIYSHSSGYTLLDHNLFEDCDGEAEIISVKSNDHIVSNNTFIDCYGEITLRNCHRVLVEGNFMLNPGGQSNANGVRAYGTGHRIVNNYFEGLTGAAIIIRTGDIERRWRSEQQFRETYGEDFNYSIYGGYQIPVDIQVAHNTAVDCERALLIGDTRANYPRPPRNVQVANNIFDVRNATMIEQLSPPEDWFWAGNIFHSRADGAQLGMDLGPDEAQVVDPRWVEEDDLKRPAPDSPAIGAGFDLRQLLREDAAGHERGARMHPLRGKPVVTKDMHGRPRGNPPTIGAEEPVAGPRRRPLTPRDVGPDAA